MAVKKNCVLHPSLVDISLVLVVLFVFVREFHYFTRFYSRLEELAYRAIERILVLIFCG